MSTWFWGGSPRVGDEVRVVEPVARSLWGSTVRPGRRGVVVRAGWSRLRVKLDDGYGFAEVDLPTSAVRVVRRDVGEHRFVERRRPVQLARIGVALAMVLPIAIYVVRYVMATGGTTGLVEAIAVGTITSVVELAGIAIAAPVPTALYLAVAWALWRFARAG